MGLSAEFFFNLVRNKEFIKDKNVALLGIPCPENNKLMHQYLKKFLPPEFHKKIYKSERNMFGKILFKDFINVSNLDIIDINDFEGADLIYNLTSNKSFPINLSEKYDIIFDLDVHEHVSSSDNFLNNVFQFLKKGGYYIWQNPSNNWLDHSPRQIGPTFYNDLVFANSDLLRLVNLGLRISQTECLVDLTSCYDDHVKRMQDLSFWRSKHPYGNTSNDLNKYKAKGPIIEILNSIKEPINVQGSIKKINSFTSLNFDFVQFMYRYYPDIEYKESKNKSPIVFRDNAKLTFVQSLKNYFISRRFSIPGRTKLFILHTIIAILKKIR